MTRSAVLAILGGRALQPLLVQLVCRSLVTLWASLLVASGAARASVVPTSSVGLPVLVVGGAVVQVFVDHFYLVALRLARLARSLLALAAVVGRLLHRVQEYPQIERLARFLVRAGSTTSTLGWGCGLARLALRHYILSSVAVRLPLVSAGLASLGTFILFAWWSSRSSIIIATFLLPSPLLLSVPLPLIASTPISIFIAPSHGIFIIPLPVGLSLLPFASGVGSAAAIVVTSAACVIFILFAVISVGILVLTISSIVLRMPAVLLLFVLVLLILLLSLSPPLTVSLVSPLVPVVLVASVPGLPLIRMLRPFRGRPGPVGLPLLFLVPAVAAVDVFVSAAPVSDILACVVPLLSSFVL